MSETDELWRAIRSLRVEVVSNRDDFIACVIEPRIGALARIERLERRLSSVAWTVTSVHDPNAKCVTEPLCDLCRSQARSAPSSISDPASKEGKP